MSVVMQLDATTVSSAPTPAGGRITVEVAGQHLAWPWRSSFWLTSGTVDLHLYTAEVGVAVEQISELGEPAGRQGFDYGDGEVTVLHSPDGQVGVCWTGPFHQLVYFVRTSRVVLDAVVRFLDRLELLDEPAGLVVHSRDPGDLRHRRLGMSTRFDGLFDISVLHRPDHARVLPTWAGSQVRGGELWRFHAGPGVNEMLLLDAPTAVAAISPIPGTERRALTVASELTVGYDGLLTRSGG